MPTKNESQWCFSFWAGAKNPGYNEKAALLKDTKWQSGNKITISFLDGDADVQTRVKNAAMKWVTNLANLTFEFRTDTNDTNIRISFRYNGSWSVLGTTCKNITDKSQPTMNFGWLNKDSTDEELNRVVLHEFGHALGLIHEHLNPLAGIHWNVERVKKDLSEPPNSWSPQQIQTNMFQTFTQQELALTRMDKSSIMMYPIPATWTTDGFSVGLNADLSQTDKDFIKNEYP